MRHEFAWTLFAVLLAGCSAQEPITVASGEFKMGVRLAAAGGAAPAPVSLASWLNDVAPVGTAPPRPPELTYINITLTKVVFKSPTRDDFWGPVEGGDAELDIFASATEQMGQSFVGAKEWRVVDVDKDKPEEALTKAPFGAFQILTAANGLDLNFQVNENDRVLTNYARGRLDRIEEHLKRFDVSGGTAGMEMEFASDLAGLQWSHYLLAAKWLFELYVLIYEGCDPDDECALLTARLVRDTAYGFPLGTAGITSHKVFMRLGGGGPQELTYDPTSGMFTTPLGPPYIQFNATTNMNEISKAVHSISHEVVFSGRKVDLHLQIEVTRSGLEKKP